MRIGIFGGSFNPPHKMHEDICNYLINNNLLDLIIFVPTGNKYKKEGLLDSVHRYNMLNILTENNSKFKVSDYELKDELTYTYQTLDYFNDLYKEDEIYFICGSDNIKSFDTWKNYEYILNTYKIIVINRNNDDISNYKRDSIIEIKDNKFSDLSSTFIRDEIINNKKSNYINDRVLDYIIKNNLYN